MSFESGTGDGTICGILPTFVTPTDAKNYINETDAQWTRLAQDFQAATIDASLQSSFAADLAAWQAFRDDSLVNVGWLNTTATMEQTDRWVAKIAPWRASLVAAGAQVTGPDPTGAGQGVPSSAPSTTTISWLVGGAIVVGGLFALGYMRRSFGRVLMPASGG